MLRPGLYEQVVNQLIQSAITRDLGHRFHVEKHVMDEAESVGILAQYMSGIIKTALAALRHEDILHRRVDLCNHLIQRLAEETKEPLLQELLIHTNAELLLALLDTQNSVLSVNKKANVSLIRPATSIAQSSLFTGARDEPNMVNELKQEILTSDRVDMLVSFIKWSGLRLLMDELIEFTRTRPLRIITTSYMGATDIKAIDELRSLPNTHIRVSYDTQRTRLHAKAYVLHRETGFSTAYIGSSNLSNAALSTGLEWNVKITAQDMADTFEKVAATFEGYWNDSDFTPYEDGQRPVLVRALQAERYQDGSTSNFQFDIAPYGFQQEILDRLEAERRLRGHYRNLIVAATGTGKTVISAFDYKRFRQANPGRIHRLLFVAHREEILKQSRDCFRSVLRDQNFGELFVGGHEPSNLDHLFISIQTLNSRELTERISPRHFDFIVIDEFHHAASKSYQELLNHFTPSVMLGLTATPERLDGRNVTEYFDGRIAAEIRLPEAIERELLAPFQYFGVSDSVDLSDLHWRRGGYDAAELSNLYTGNRRRADLVLRSLRHYVTDTNKVVGLGFCVSVAHAEFMSHFMTQRGVPSMALHAKSLPEDRVSAKRRLANGHLRFIFVVDLYNEGVDIPAVNTVLFLRPTESLTVFLQQLGRGLRLSEGKECLTVLDFIGQSHKRYSFEAKFRALLTNTNRSFSQEINNNFQHVPRGCFIQLEKQAREYVLQNIRQAIGRQSLMMQRILSFEEDTGKPLTLSALAKHYRLSMRELYAGSNSVSFARLCTKAGLREEFAEPDEAILTKVLPRIGSINSRRWITFLLSVLDEKNDVTPRMWSELEHQMLLMFHYTVWQKPIAKCGFANILDSLQTIKRNAVLTGEYREVLRFNLENIDFVDEPVDLGLSTVLDLHCDYSLHQILAGVGFFTEEEMPAMREGVKYLSEKNADLFFITLNKSDKEYSPTTMYKDYAINDVLFHWQSQSTTRADSRTGQRYIHHKKNGHRIALFVREYKSDASGTAPYTYLGTAEYVSHSGSHPMNITWQLHRPIPAALLKKVNRLLVV